MNKYKEFLAMLSTEFHRYLMENEDLGEGIPANAMVVFEIEGEDNFNRWHREVSLGSREPNQPLVFVKVKKWRQHSAIEELHLDKTTGELEWSPGGR